MMKDANQVIHPENQVNPHYRYREKKSSPKIFPLSGSNCNKMLDLLLFFLSTDCLTYGQYYLKPS